MKLRNPWIDPRITRLRPEDLQAYLLRTGWQQSGPATNPELLRYGRPADEDAPTLLIPVRVDDGASLQWLIEAVGELAVWQGRYAGDVLTDVLTQFDGEPRTSPPGPAPAPPVSHQGCRDGG